jgi:hypothetical protein
LAFRDLDEVVFEDPPADMETNLEAAEAATLFKKKDGKLEAVIGLTLSDEQMEHVQMRNGG